MGVGSRVLIPALGFGEAWAKEKFPEAWRTATCTGTVVRELQGGKFAVRYDIGDGIQESHSHELVLLDGPPAKVKVAAFWAANNYYL